MGLTEEERRRLDALADDLSRDDPQLSRALSGERQYHGRHWSPAVVASLLVTVALPLLILGVSLGAPLLFAVGSIALVGAAWVGVASACGSLRARGRRR
jgi:hypothetical protein